MSSVLITGSSSGFGIHAARALAAQGHAVFATMRGVDGANREAAESLTSWADDNGLALHTLELDVTDDASVEAAVAEAADRAGGLDAVINNAGQLYLGVAEAFRADELRAQLEVNLVGTFRVAREALPPMRRRGRGLIVNVSSTSGRIAMPFSGLYHASKWGLEGLTEAMRYELAPLGVEVVLLEPGGFRTPIYDKARRPADMDREAEYGEVAGLMDQLAGAFEELFADPAVPTDPSLVADAIVRLVEAPHGERPVRTVVGADLGVEALNEAVEPFRTGVLATLDMSDLDGPAAEPDTADAVRPV